MGAGDTWANDDETPRLRWSCSIALAAALAATAALMLAATRQRGRDRA